MSNNEMKFISHNCCGYNGIVKIKYLEINEKSDIRAILSKIIKELPPMTFGGKEVIEENIEAIYYCLKGEYLFNNDLILDISYYSDVITLGYFNTIVSFEDFISDVDEYTDIKELK